MRIKLMELNTQDLFLRLAYPLEPSDLVGLSELQWQQLGSGDEPLKPLGRLFGLAQVFLDELPDVAMLCEVGGEESLLNFNRLFLGDAYEPYFTGGNSERGIECAYLVRRDLGLRVELSSHRDTPVSFSYPHEVDPEGLAAVAARAQKLSLPHPGQRRLSRDVPELRLYRGSSQAVSGPPGSAAQPASEAPGLILLMAHLKSQYDPDGIDPEGRVRRAAELRAILAIRSGIEAASGPGAPVILAGDMNGCAARVGTAEAFRPIYASSDLEDVLELARRPTHERITHLTFISSEIHASQLDYVFLPRSLHAAVVKEESYVYRYRFDGEEEEIQMPLSLKERAFLPSDHYPLVCVLDIDAL